MAMKIRYESFSECGPRRKNEDYIKIEDFGNCNRFLTVLCDGMGGHLLRDVASKLVAEHLCTYWRHNQMQDDSVGKVRSTCKETMIAFNSKSRVDMGTTMTMVSIHGDKALFAHCGDSRIYHSRDEEIIYKSHDHVGTTPQGWPIVTKAFFSGGNNYEPEVHKADLLSGELIPHV